MKVAAKDPDVRMLNETWDDPCFTKATCTLCICRRRAIFPGLPIDGVFRTAMSKSPVGKTVGPARSSLRGSACRPRLEDILRTYYLCSAVCAFPRGRSGLSSRWPCPGTMSKPRWSQGPREKKGLTLESWRYGAKTAYLFLLQGSSGCPSWRQIESLATAHLPTLILASTVCLREVSLVWPFL